jgi:hypothetical protein
MYIPPACQPIVNEIAGLESEKDALQADLHEASPSQKPGIVQQINRLNAKIHEAEDRLAECVADAAPLPPLEATLAGAATITTTKDEAPGPFGGPITVRLLFDGFRTQVTILNFTPISTPPIETPLGINVTTVRLRSSGVGSFGNRNISIRLHLEFDQSLEPFGQDLDSRLRVTMSTTGSGSPVQNNGNVTLVGSNTFEKGFFQGENGTLTITGTINPSPIP